LLDEDYLGCEPGHAHGRWCPYARDVAVRRGVMRLVAQNLRSIAR
jgi:hypothetical protein